MTDRATNAHRRNDLEFGSKEQRLERLLERFLTDVESARGAITAGDVMARVAAIDHALEIVRDIEAALDHRAAPALAANVCSLLELVDQRLEEANQTMTVGALDPCVRIIGELLAAIRDRPR